MSDGGEDRIPDPKDFILSRERSEVHLLLDNLANNPDKTLAQMISDDDLRKVCEISWPPDKSDVAQAAQAALLIRIKDQLNRSASPASGASIAFTLLVVQEDDPDVSDGGGRGDTADTPSRTSLARTAYPGFVDKAKNFRRQMWHICLALLVCLFLTCLLSWYTAVLNAKLAQLAAAQTNLTAAEQKISDAEGSTSPNADKQNVPKPPTASPGLAASGSASTGSPAPTYVVRYCQRRLTIPVTDKPPGKVDQATSATEFQLCDARDQRMGEVAAIRNNLSHWLMHTPEKDAAHNYVGLYATSMSSVLGTSVLPVLYGILGAAAAVVRLLSTRVRQSLLSPRDLTLAVQQLALGAVIGACIGLFVSAPGTDAHGDAMLLGPVALSSSALSFVAGFGVDAVFNALQGLIARVFNPNPQTQSPH